MTATHQVASVSALCSASGSWMHVPTVGHKCLVIVGGVPITGER
jgi:hypothetical protein